jgi:hypothetical protein
MPPVRLGLHAYKREATGAPEIKLVNRFFERCPTNEQGNIALLSRPGTGLFGTFLPGTAGGGIRKITAKRGLFNDDLFIISGDKLYRYLKDTGVTLAIQGTIRGVGIPSVDYDQGAGYERVFIADGSLLNYYDGGTHASGTFTNIGSPGGGDVIEIDGTYYSWHASDVDNNSPDGTSAHPWLALTTSDPFQSMADMLGFIGLPGVNFSTALAGPATTITALASGGPPATVLTITAISDLSDGNSITTSVFSGSNVSAGQATLSGGGIHALSGVVNGTGKAISIVNNLKSFIMCAVGGTNEFLYLRPGSTTIDALDFATKESNPDPITDIRTIGDMAAVIGTASTEFWYATGNNDNPLAPLSGRTFARGAIEGTVVVLEDSIILVGSDGKVYNIGGSSGSFGMAPVGPISDNGIEERIRITLRREAGLIP